MCLVTRQKRHERLKKDMKVYKALKEYDDGFYSPLHGYKWEWDILHETVMGVTKNVTFNTYFANPDFWFADSIAVDYYNEFGGTVTVISEGFHAYMAPERANLNDWFEGDKLIILCFTIPAGAKVFRDATGLIVSDKMILKREDNEN